MYVLPFFLQNATIVPEAPSGIANDRATVSNFQGNLDIHQAGLRELNTLYFGIETTQTRDSYKLFKQRKTKALISLCDSTADQHLHFLYLDLTRQVMTCGALM